ncbi:MAG: hypothetical protein J6Z82_02910 [Schwartzia sp.]|nr:hypothetical protein [Schwartzia sp. (in: firmicutes)]
MSSYEDWYNTLPEAMNNNKMTDKKKSDLYEKLWKDNDFWIGFKKNEIAIIKNTIWNGKISTNSYSFCERECDKSKDEKTIKRELLSNIFGIKTKQLFEDKFNEAVSGSELNKITTLHSSSLCCLLFFYNIKNNPLELELLTPKGKMKIEFTDSVFEFKSPVFNRPSNIDVVLKGNIIEPVEMNRKDVLLFLESKFAEYYLATGTTCDINIKYFDEKPDNYPNYSYEIYRGDKNILKKLNIDRKSEEKTKNNSKYYVLDSEETFYIEGIKQMVSHYCGIRNLIEGRFHKNTNNDSDKEKVALNKMIKTKHPIIILGEILFDHIIGDFSLKSGKKCIDCYKEKYKILANALYEQVKNGNLEHRLYILSEPLKYSSVNMAVKEIEPQIKAFYRMNLSAKDADSKPIKVVCCPNKP